MDEIKIYLDKNKTNEVKDKVEFEGVVAGEKSVGELYVCNTINYFVDLELELIGDHIKILKTIKNLKPMGMKKIEFEFDPKITTMKPITAKLNIKIEYTII